MLVRCGAEEILIHAGGNIKWCECLWKLQLKIFLPYHSGQPSGEPYPQRCVHKCTRKHVWTIYNVSNSLVLKWLKLEAPKWLLTEKRINKLCRMRTMEYYPALKRNGWKLHTTTYMNITIIMMIDEWHHFCHWAYHKSCPTPLMLRRSRKQPLIPSNQKVCNAQEFLGLLTQVHGSVLFSKLHQLKPAWVLMIPFFRGSSGSRDQNQVSCIEGRFFTVWATREVQNGLWRCPQKVAWKWKCYFLSCVWLFAILWNCSLPDSSVHRIL